MEGFFKKMLQIVCFSVVICLGYSNVSQAVAFEARQQAGATLKAAITKVGKNLENGKHAFTVLFAMVFMMWLLEKMFGLPSSLLCIGTDSPKDQLKKTALLFTDPLQQYAKNVAKDLVGTVRSKIVGHNKSEPAPGSVMKRCCLPPKILKWLKEQKNTISLAPVSEKSKSKVQPASSQG